MLLVKEITELGVNKFALLCKYVCESASASVTGEDAFNLKKERIKQYGVQVLLFPACSVSC